MDHSAVTATAPSEAAAAESGGALRDAPSLSDRLPRPWLFPFAAFAAAWAVILTTWYLSDRLYHAHRPWTFHFVFKDSAFYLGIAHYGYPATLTYPWDDAANPGRVVFFPLFPGLIKAASYVTGGDYPAAALVAEVLAGAASALAVWALASRLRGHRVADRAVLLYCFFPGAMTFGMAYAEPLGVALAAFALLALVDRRWLTAGLLAGLASAERETLIVLTPVVAVEAVRHLIRHGVGPRQWRVMLAPLLSPLGVLCFFGYLGHRYHDYRFWFHAEDSGWGNRPGYGPHATEVGLWLDPAVRHIAVIQPLFSAMFLAALAGIALTLLARLPLPVTLYQLAIVAFALLPANSVTKPRYIWLAFPMFTGAAAKLPARLYWPVLLASAAGLAFLIGWWPNHIDGPAP